MFILVSAFSLVRRRHSWLVSSIVAIAATASAQLANPPRLSYATYAASDVFEVDSAGYAYVGGGSGCAYLTKLNQTGTAAIWSVCLPLPQVDAVAVGQQGYIYVAGTNQNQPVSATVIKLSPDAQQIIYSAPIAGNVTKLVVDRAGSAYVIGSPNANFKPTPGGYVTTSGSPFVAKLDASGALQYATYLDVSPANMAVDSQGQVWVVGTAVPPSAPPSGCGVSFDCVSASGVRKLDANGAKLLVSKTFGGGSTGDRFEGWYDKASGVAVDGTDSIWVVGTAESSGVPTTPGAIERQRPPSSLAAHNGAGGIGYAVKFSASGDLLYGTYVGTNNSGVPDRTITSVAVDGQGRPSFALNAGLTSLNKGAATVMVLSADVSSVLASTDFNSLVTDVALDGSGGLYVAGNTSRLAFLTTPGAYQGLYPGGPVSYAPISGYAAKFDLTTPAPTAQFSTVVNAASLVPGDNPTYQEGAVTPGELVTLFGNNLPSNPKVTFDGRLAPILYADSKQINTVVPFEVSAPSTAVSLEGVRGYVLPVWPAVPALFTADGSGTGQLAALNENGTVNSSANPAKPSSIVAVYMTGVGAMMPPIGDGQFGPLQPPFPVPVLGASALINGVGAPVLFVGQAPGLIAGAVQVNVQIPADTPSGNASLAVYIGSYSTQIGGTAIVVAK